MLQQLAFTNMGINKPFSLVLWLSQEELSGEDQQFLLKR
jgi:hypothetical protein